MDEKKKKKKKKKKTLHRLLTYSAYWYLREQNAVYERTERQHLSFPVKEILQTFLKALSTLHHSWQLCPIWHP